VKPLDNLRKKLESLIAELVDHEEMAELMRHQLHAQVGI
jgi:hypothetical protein